MLTITPQRTYRVNHASKLLDVSRATIHRLVRAKKLVLVKVNERARGITADSLERHIASGMAENDG